MKVFDSIIGAAKKFRIFEGRIFVRIDGAAEKWFATQAIVANRSVSPPRVALYVSIKRLLLNILARKRTSPEAIFVLQVGRFGNSFQQFSNALRLADRSQIKKIVAEPAPWLVNNFVLGTKLEFCQVTRSSSHLNNVESLVVGRFLWAEELAYQGSALTELEAARELSKHMELQVRTHDFGSEDLVIHLRGGDVYSDKPPRDYGQPPLGFYQAILEFNPWSSVTVVHEDEKPVVLEPLRHVLEYLKIPHTFRSSSLHTDLSVLLAAQNLVVSNGSFARAICKLSLQLNKVFRMEGTFGLGELPAPAREIRVTDTVGNYSASMLNKNWANTSNQRNLMVTYPKENLRIDQET